jgi:hypothetical protein
MIESAEWDAWLAKEDSIHALAPEGYDDDVALARVKELRQRLANVLAKYKVSAASPELYQDSTGLAGYRITADGGWRSPALAWVLLSHFGKLATVKDCQDLDLLADIRGALEGDGLKYIPYSYVANKTYNGKCKALIGFSWANRYFSLATQLNYEMTEDVSHVEQGAVVSSNAVFVMKRGDPLISREVAEALALIVIEERYSSEWFTRRGSAEIADDGDSWLVTVANGLVDLEDRSPTPLVNGIPVARSLTVAIRKASGEVISVS